MEGNLPIHQYGQAPFVPSPTIKGLRDRKKSPQTHFRNLSKWFKRASLQAMSQLPHGRAQASNHHGVAGMRPWT